MLWITHLLLCRCEKRRSLVSKTRRNNCTEFAYLLAKLNLFLHINNINLVYRFRKIVGKSNFSEQFRKLINRYKRIGYSLDIMRQTACLVVNPIIVDGYASFFNCRRRFGPQTQWRPLRKTLTSGLGLDDMSLAWPAVVQLLVFIYSGIL